MQILLVEDSPTDAKLVISQIRRMGREISFERVDDESSLRKALSERAWDLVISDWSMPSFTATDAMRIVKEHDRDLGFIIVSGAIGEAAAVEAMRAGAHDYVLKDQLARLVPAIERELADTAVRRSHAREEARKAALLETAIDAVIGVDHTGAITEFNPAAEETFGYTRAEVIGRDLAETIVPPDLREQHRAGMQRYLSSGESTILGRRIELRAMRKGGEQFPVELAIARVGTEEPPSFLGFARDISDRRKAEESLLERVQVASLVADVGMALTGSDDLDASLQRCTESIVRHLGVALARVWTLEENTVLRLRASAGIQTLPDAGPIAALDVGNIARQRMPEVVNQTPEDDPDARWMKREGLLAFAGHPLMAGGELLGVMKVFASRPIADAAVAGLGAVADALAIGIHGKRAERARGTLERQLRQTQKMDAIGRLAGGVAHDFNNILSVILGYSDMLLSDMASEAPERTDLEEIRKAGKRAADLTRQLLTFSRQQVFEAKVLDLNEVLSGMDRMLHRIIGEDVKVTFVTAPDAGRLRGDRGSIEQVVMNLVVNARDAMERGGKLTIETANVVLDETFQSLHVGVKVGPHVMLAVTDTGTGMDKDTQARIFEPFFTTKPKGQGTGLGLSTVFGIVQQSGGSIWVYSEKDHGTTFKVYFPRIDANTETESPVVRTPHLGTETILLVEDEPQVRAVVLGILRRCGYHVIPTASAREALAILDGGAAIDLMLTDVVMPEVSGVELARRVAVDRPSLRVLFMSGYTDDTVVRHGILEATVAFIQKPITPDSLARKVREVIEGAPARA